MSNPNTSREKSENAILLITVPPSGQITPFFAHLGRSLNARDDIWSSEVKASPKYEHTSCLAIGDWLT